MIKAQYSGRNSLGEVAELLSHYRPQRVFLVTGRASFSTSGAESALEPLLSGIAVVQFCDFTANPQCEDVDRGILLFRKKRCNFVIAIGGGSVIDMAKLINICGVHDGPVRDYILDKRAFTRSGLPLVAVPTTAGSGAETTHFVTVYIGDRKYSVAHRLMLPDHFVLDHRLTMTLPPEITASTGIDALSQAVESYWCVDGTDETRRHAREAIDCITQHLHRAVTDPTEASREKMLRAANLAGKAINVTKTTAPHALSYAFTSAFGVPHGHAVGLTLGAIFEHNLGTTEDDVADPRGVGYVRDRMNELSQALDSSPGTNIRRLLAQLMQDIGLETKLSRLGVARSDLPDLVRSVNEERLRNNPRRLSPETIGRILEGIY